MNTVIHPKLTICNYILKVNDFSEKQPVLVRSSVSPSVVSVPRSAVLGPRPGAEKLVQVYC